jgi:hypothetical protein
VTKTTTKALTLAEASKLVSTFHNTLKAHNTAQNQKGGHKDLYEVATRKRLYDMLAEAYGVSLALTQDMKVLGEYCANNKVKPPKADANPHATVVNILFGKRNKKGELEARSAWKYSKGFRAAAAMGWTAANYADNLDKWTYTKEGTDKVLRRHIALETYDTVKHGNPEAVLTEQEQKAALAWMAKTQAPLAQCHGTFVEKPEDRQLVGLVGQFDAASGVWNIRAVNQTDHQKAWNGIAAKTVEAMNAWIKQAEVARAAHKGELPLEGQALIDAVKAQNEAQAKANDNASLAAKLVGFDVDGDFMWPTTSKSVPAVTASEAPEASDSNSAAA